MQAFLFGNITKVWQYNKYLTMSQKFGNTANVEQYRKGLAIPLIFGNIIATFQLYNICCQLHIYFDA